jgi:Peptidase M50B-like
MDGIDWTLSQWGTQETIFICFYCGYFVLNYLLWNTAVVKPMALIAVFTHEMCHATACWLTCGSVKGIEVYGNEGSYIYLRAMIYFGARSSL